MSDLRRTIELRALAHLLDTDERELAFLDDRPVAELRDLRELTTAAVVGRHDKRLRTLAGAARLVPAPITAKIAQHALGPVFAARVAGALEPREAVKLAEHLSPDFLAELAAWIDPVRVPGMLQAMPGSLAVEIGRRMRDAGEYVALGRLIGAVPTEVAVAVSDGASGEAILSVLVCIDDTPTAAAYLRALPADARARLNTAAEATGHAAEVAPLLA